MEGTVFRQIKKVLREERSAESSLSHPPPTPHFPQCSHLRSRVRGGRLGKSLRINVESFMRITASPDMLFVGFSLHPIRNIILETLTGI
jgi:hypothetical protein